ncbi:TetR/AcrR family transcriptional regulator [Pediococcus claussenii]|uniref:Transcriptional regulator, TetR family n=1 Tax=Pediococcus claussenii (strain ATCC BAA-344 / DSM 14800 / JCM 18046 / KCTC 3811 / LMG 21948 / P06) TaxID=701521 RepID=G8PEP5_PEDCP|nr:TetR/AcrR family transcriptional regulator [Pediococcus claussenii]AEV94425.1 Transcriptional regulator, TetR family [Pediococcus claussenii ATCC BAA-344]ANZ69645.1 transcriptional regulator [Pediococcus claussenii]ANZ71462.1 transcriptional regulator [Pediococcus claussenii]KRN19871.1 hypothetical protein IV79_GL001160 [Pediococcus claussenii]
MASREDTKQKIVNALFDLLEKNDLESISVSNICQQASVSRMSYYRIFKNKDQIIEYELNKIFDEFFNYLMVMPMHDIPAFLEAFFTICRRNSQYIKALIGAGLNEKLYKSVNEHLTELIDKGIFKLRTELPELWVSFVAGGLNQMIVKWMNDDLSETNQEMVMVARRFLK